MPLVMPYGMQFCVQLTKLWYAVTQTSSLIHITGANIWPNATCIFTIQIFRDSCEHGQRLLKASVLSVIINVHNKSPVVERLCCSCQPYLAFQRHMNIIHMSIIRLTWIWFLHATASTNDDITVEMSAFCIHLSTFHHRQLYLKVDIIQATVVHIIIHGLTL